MMQRNDTYSYFSDIVCINLATRSDRRSYAQSVFQKFHIPARFHLVEKHPKGGMYGCFDSHIQVIKHAYDSGKNNLLVFEDDLLPTETYSDDHVKHAIQFMKESKDWEIMYFGYFVFNYNLNPNKCYLNAEVVYPHVVKYNPFATHAYCLNRKGMEKILNKHLSYIGRVHYDIFLAEHSEIKSYCYTPMLFDQKLCFQSDIEARNLVEHAARNMQCFADKTKVLWRVSVVKDHLDQHLLFYIFTVLIAATVVFVTCVISNKPVPK